MRRPWREQWPQGRKKEEKSFKKKGSLHATKSLSKLKTEKYPLVPAISSSLVTTGMAVSGGGEVEATWLWVEE